MDPLQSPTGSGLNLFTILVNVAFGFVGGLMLLLGPKETIDYGSKLAGQLINLTGSGQMSSFAMFAPYVVLAPLGGLVVKQLSSVRSPKSFAFFAGAVAVGFAIAFLAQGYFKTVII